MSLLKILRNSAVTSAGSSDDLDNKMKVNEHIESEQQKRSDSSYTTTSVYSNSTDVSSINLEHNVEQIIQNKVKRKSVSFNEQTDLFLIPTREEIAALIRARTFKNIIMDIKRHVHFNKVVNVFPIPSRKDLASIAGELWYSKDDIARMENDVFGTLR